MIDSHLNHELKLSILSSILYSFSGGAPKTHNVNASGLAAAEQEAQTTAADQADHPSSVKSLPEKGSLMPKVTDTSSCTAPNLSTLMSCTKTGIAEYH